jgi:hypothetical protein
MAETERDRATSVCRKSETVLNSPDEQSCRSAWPQPEALDLSFRTAAGAKSAEKNFPGFFPLNPLISIDSDERIQGNPRKSNPHNPVFSQRNGEGPRKAKPIGWTASQATQTEIYIYTIIML